MMSIVVKYYRLLDCSATYHDCVDQGKRVRVDWLAESGPLRFSANQPTCCNVARHLIECDRHWISLG